MSVPDKTRNLIYLSLGSNIRPQENLRLAVELLALQVGVVSLSSAWRTPAVGSHGPDFLNAAILIKTDLPPDMIKSIILQPIEAKLGRVRTTDKNSPRTIDIDILVVNRIVYDKELWRRAHLAVPLSEINNELAHPESGASIAEVARQLSKVNPIHAEPHVLKKIINPNPDHSY